MAEIAVAPAGSQPFEVELVVLEEDRWLVLSASNWPQPEREATETLVRSMESSVPPEVGKLLIRGNRGLAIVHDLDQDPTTDVTTISRLLDRLFDHCLNEGIQSIALQPLGSVHGALAVEEFLALLAPASQGRVSRIWVIHEGTQQSIDGNE